MPSSMRSDKPTHTGTLKHVNPNVHATTVKLTPSAMYWVTPGRTFYKKTDGSMKGGGPNPLWRLDITSIKEIES